MIDKKQFDLNTGKILENWEVHHAIREIIANALDEQKLSNSKDIEIFQDKKDKDIWHIKDFGRGLEVKNLTQNENPEKTKSNNLIGQFGVGLKDSLATLCRNNIKVKIESKYFVTEGIENRCKSGFKDINTLHVILREKIEDLFVGTEFTIYGIKSESINKSKNNFLEFTDYEVLESTDYGQIIKKQEKGNIYINGLKVAEEPSFLFSYNITKLNKGIKKALNRERTNVGRTAYSSRIKSILLASTSKSVIDILFEEVKKIETGQASDEVKDWQDITIHAIENSEEKDNYYYISGRQATEYFNILGDIRYENKPTIVLPGNVVDKIKNDNIEINTLESFINKVNDNFKYEFIDIAKLTEKERNIFSYKDKILKILKINTKDAFYKEILISETMQKNIWDFQEILGVWLPEKKQIIIKRSTLTSLKKFSSVLIHELTHGKTGTKDGTREFENELTNVIGELIYNIFS